MFLEPGIGEIEKRLGSDRYDRQSPPKFCQQGWQCWQSLPFLPSENQSTGVPISRIRSFMSSQVNFLAAGFRRR